MTSFSSSGVLHNLSRDYAPAIAAFESALALRPSDYSLWNKVHDIHIVLVLVLLVIHILILVIQYQWIKPRNHLCVRERAGAASERLLPLE